jgi:spore coat protein A
MKYRARRPARKPNTFLPRLEPFEDRSLLNATVPGVTLDPLTIPKYVTPLPQALDPSFVYQPVGTTDVKLETGATFVGASLYQVGAYQIPENLGLGLKNADGSPVLTTVYGYGTSDTTATYPGRSFVVQSGTPIAVNWVNGLDSNTHILPVDPTTLDPADDTAAIPPGQLYTVTPRPVANTAVTGTTSAKFVTFDQGIPIVTHVHGGHTQAAYDGTPLQWFTPTGLAGADFAGNPFVYDNSQPAGTIWYHDHAMGVTRLNVYAGLAGFYIIRDATDTGNPLTSPLPTYAADANGNPILVNSQLVNYEMPLAIQDRMFYGPGVTDDPATPWVEAPGQLYYPAEVLKGTTATFPSVHPEFFGDTILVNGQAWPVLDVEPRMYRFRVLNGSQARFYNLHLDPLNGQSHQTFYQIGTDDGLLAAPVALNSLLVAPGERADILIDFSKFAGQTFIVTNDAKGPFPKGTPADPMTTGQIMMFRVGTTVTDTTHGNQLPGTLNTITPIAQANPQDKALFETVDPYGRLIQLLGTPTGGFTAFDGIANADTVRLVRDQVTGVVSAVQVWNVSNTTADVHPIHLHSVSFQIVSRQTFNAKVNAATGVMTNFKLTGQLALPAANEMGWKDTVQMYPGTVTTIVAKFDLPGKYVWHCHILEHEEHDMMHWLVVLPPAAAMSVGSPVVAASTTTGGPTDASLLVSALTATPTQVIAPATPVDTGAAASPPARIDPTRPGWDDVLAADLLGVPRRARPAEGVLDQVFAEFVQRPVDDPLGDLALV